MTILTETRTLIETALEGDPALASLTITGVSPETLAFHIAPGVPATTIGGSTYSPAPPFRRETVKAALALPGLLDPTPFDPAAVLEPQQRGIERRQRELQTAAGARLDQLADFITVARTRLEQRQDEHLGAALLELRAEHRHSMSR